MSLYDAVGDVVKGMIEAEDELKSMAESRQTRDASTIRIMLVSFRKQLEIALKASGGNNQFSTMGNAQLPLMPQTQHALEIEKAKAEFRKPSEKARQEEESEPKMSLCVNGPNEGLTVPIDPQMPIGAYTLVSGIRYVLSDDGKLHHKPVEDVKS